MVPDLLADCRLSAVARRFHVVGPTKGTRDHNGSAYQPRTRTRCACLHMCVVVRKHPHLGGLRVCAPASVHVCDHMHVCVRDCVCACVCLRARLRQHLVSMCVCGWSIAYTFFVWLFLLVDIVCLWGVCVCVCVCDQRPENGTSSGICVSALAGSD